MSKHSCSYATHAQIQDFFSGEWGGPGPTARKQSGQRFFFLFIFSPQLILKFTGRPMVL